MLDEATKDRIRVHLRVPVDGVAQNGFTTGYRFFEGAPIGQLEYRMNNLKPYNEAELTGLPIGDARLYNTPNVGDTLTFTALTSTTSYTVTAPIAAEANPLNAVAREFARAINVVFAPLGLQATYSAPIVNIGIGATPIFAQLIVQRTSPVPFTFTVVSTGSTMILANRQGNLPQPQFKDDDDNLICGYVPLCDYLESGTAKSDAFIGFDKADVVNFSPRELIKRDQLYTYWCQKLANYFGVPIFTAGHFNASGGGLTI